MDEDGDIDQIQYLQYRNKQADLAQAAILVAAAEDDTTEVRHLDFRRQRRRDNDDEMKYWLYFVGVNFGVVGILYSFDWFKKIDLHFVFRLRQGPVT